MGLRARVLTIFNEERDVYIRINSIFLNNHGAPSTATFRGYLTDNPVAENAPMVWELTVSIMDLDVTQNVWAQAYDALKSHPYFEDKVEDTDVPPRRPSGGTPPRVIDMPETPSVDPSAPAQPPPTWRPMPLPRTPGPPVRPEPEPEPEPDPGTPPDRGTPPVDPEPEPEPNG